MDYEILESDFSSEIWSILREVDKGMAWLGL